ncbi:hypothetical protein STSP_00780 [Streptomyces jeddahensis]|uniref:Uncharacterized protein n=2 Tax=Streptomyces jeddahensis TaxID=1716141 RepID=A0A177I0F1_9ACTN|nr:hypothetical protein [Streptomyces jeddahensis]OAH16535.1 hypothetical protein STSP_00780 [Streptomyces jeddahensis]
MHTYNPSRQPYQSTIPSMRPPQDTTGSRSATPIYDTLYAEYRRSFRTLPGDRSGEEDLVFTGFGTGQGPGRHGTRGAGDHAGPTSPTTGVWQAVGRQHGFGRLLPAALPPAPRRER